MVQAAGLAFPGAAHAPLQDACRALELGTSTGAGVSAAAGMSQNDPVVDRQRMRRLLLYAGGTARSVASCFAFRRRNPDVAEPSRTEERWAPIPASAQGVRGTYYRCELCAPDGRPIRRIDPSPAVLDAMAVRKRVRQARRACREAREQAALARWYSYSERVHRQSTHQ